MTDGETISVVVADDQSLLRAALHALIGNMPGVTVLAEAADGAAAAAAARTSRPDVVLMDIRMPGTDGVEATRQITGDPRCAGVKVLILTTSDLDELVYAALRAGASGFLLKDVPPEEGIERGRELAGFRVSAQSMWKKSRASIVVACVRRNCRQVMS